MPHQGVVALTVSILSIIITLSFLISIFRHEKKHQANNRDEH